MFRNVSFIDGHVYLVLDLGLNSFNLNKLK